VIAARAGARELWQDDAMRDMLLAFSILVCACKATDDTSSGSGSGSMTDTGAASESTSGSGSMTDGTGASGSGSDGMTSAPTTGAPAECGGDYLCFGDDADDCNDDKCCVAAFGRIYEQDGDAWCLRAEEEYVGCAHKYNSAPCDDSGTIKCGGDGQEYFAELDTECFPHWCMTGTTPSTGGAVCGG
jgi:hypothetical protein